VVSVAHAASTIALLCQSTSGRQVYALAIDRQTEAHRYRSKPRICGVQLTNNSSNITNFTFIGAEILEYSPQSGQN